MPLTTPRPRGSRSVLATCDDYRVVQYEALCAEPRRIFAELFAFTGLEWGPAAEALASGEAAGEDGSDHPWSLRRDSRKMPRSWVGKIDPADVAEIRAGYEPFGLPWYRSDEEW
jgi:hypothetical protein